MVLADILLKDAIYMVLYVYWLLFLCKIIQKQYDFPKVGVKKRLEIIYSLYFSLKGLLKGAAYNLYWLFLQ